MGAERLGSAPSSGAPTSVLAVTVTERGRRLSNLLPYRRAHAAAAPTVREAWGKVDGLVLFLATGAAVRIVAPLLSDKHDDPAVVCVDEAGRFAVALCGGHVGGANALAREVAALLGAEPVVTTASDAAGLAGLDAIPGWRAEGDLAAVGRARLDGEPVTVSSELPGWDPPAVLDRSLVPAPASSATGPRPRVVVTDRVIDAPGLVRLHPPSLVVGIGCSTRASAADAEALLASVLRDNDLAAESIGVVASIDRRATHPAVVGLGYPLRCWSAEELATVAVPHPSDVVRRAVGTPSVAEAAALLAAGAGATLLVAKRSSDEVVVAVARRAGPPGHLSLVGLGPGGPAHRTAAAAASIRNAEVVVGYDAYVEQAADLLTSAQAVLRFPIGEETARVDRALAEAAAGRTVALVCSGDAGIYAMASLVIERSTVAPDVEVEVVPGVTAATAASAVLGAPLGHDHALISLSDLLTPWPAIEARLRAAAAADLVVALYNPRSAGRSWQLPAALALLGEHRRPDTPVGLVTAAGRPGQVATVTTLAGLDPDLVGMTTCVIVGSSTTRVIGGRMCTPRGYQP